MPTYPPEVPFKTKVLGVMVMVQKVTQAGSGIAAACVRDGHHQAVALREPTV